MPTAPSASEDLPLLAWWAGSVDALSRLTPRNRARALSLIAEAQRQAQCQARETGARQGVRDPSSLPRHWRFVLESGGVRIIFPP